MTPFAGVWLWQGGRDGDAGLVVLELDDQAEPGIRGGLKCFFDSAGRPA
jgi:hypothetical protein